VMLTLSIFSIVLLAPQGSLAQAQSSDSIQILRDARKAQREFEGHRRARLPYDWGNGSGLCLVRMGRFC
jgi:hypothetical protein